MNELSSNIILEQKMAAMRIKNLELLKRHQEIEEDRQLALRESTVKNIEKMKGGMNKNRTRLMTNPSNSQEIQSERVYRPPIRRKFESDRNENQLSQRAQRVDYNRLKHDRTREIINQKTTNISQNPELHEYAFHYRSDANADLDEPTHAKKLVIVNNKASRIGSGRFNQQQGQRKREERMRRSLGQNNGHTGGNNEFHLDVPPMPIWPNSPMHVQLIPTNLNAHPPAIDHLINTSADPIDQSPYLHNFVYSPAAVSFNGNSPVYFAHPSSSSQPTFHPYHPTNSTRPQFTLPIFSQQPTTISNINNENTSNDLLSRFRHLKIPEHENNSQTISNNEFERLHNNSYTSTTRFNSEHQRFQFRPQTFYDFSSNNPNNNNNNNFSRSSNNHRYQKSNNNNNNNNNNNISLPLSAYMNTEQSSINTDENRSNNYWTNAHSRRRINPQQRPHHQDKHQFPLSLYDPRQYGFNENSSKRNYSNNRSNTNKISNNNHEINDDSNEIDLIEEWWEDDHTDLIGIETKITSTTINDSGNSSLSTSIHLKETISDVSTTDSNIFESLDKLQQQLKLEEAVDERIASAELNKEQTTYDTAHFMQWAKEKFREELAGRLTAQEIEQHDAVTTDDDDHGENIDGLHVKIYCNPKEKQQN